MIEIRCVTGAGILPYLQAVGELRIRVFREYPYLYDGTESYEQEYLKGYSQSAACIVLLALKRDRIVGVSTGLPMVLADPAFRQPFAAAGIGISELFYLGESLLEAPERGQGIGHRFFDERERHARECGCSTAAFCSVVRPPKHALQPPGYRTHAAFWTKRGYTEHPELRAELAWKQIDSAEEVTNQLVFWTKELVPPHAGACADR